jgi:hypothetical protein
MRVLVLGILVLALVASTACQRFSGTHSKAAVKAAIEDHLKHQPGVAFENMTLEVENVTFHEDTAEALVKFHSKQAPSFAVDILYKLRRTGSGWQVESSSTASMPGTNPHSDRPASLPTQLAPQPSH